MSEEGVSQDVSDELDRIKQMDTQAKMEEAKSKVDKARKLVEQFKKWKNGAIKMFRIISNARKALPFLKTKESVIELSLEALGGKQALRQKMVTLAEQAGVTSAGPLGNNEQVMAWADYFYDELCSPMSLLENDDEAGGGPVASCEGSSAEGVGTGGSGATWVEGADPEVIA